MVAAVTGDTNVESLKKKAAWCLVQNEHSATPDLHLPGRRWDSMKPKRPLGMLRINVRVSFKLEKCSAPESHPSSLVSYFNCFLQNTVWGKPVS